MLKKKEINEKISNLERALEEACQDLIINDLETRKPQIKLFFNASLREEENEINSFLKRRDVEVIDIFPHAVGGIVVVYKNM